MHLPKNSRSGKSSPVLRAAWAALCLLLAGTACDRNAPSPTADNKENAASGPALRYLRTFNLEENDAVINVTPRMRMDPRGGLLIVDASESQIRRYSPNGKLIWYAGRPGQGPGEFTGVSGVARLPSGEIVAADRHGRLTFFDANGRQVVSTVETRLSRVEDVEVVDDSTLLISGIGDAGERGSRLHVWSIPRQVVKKSFFAPFSHQKNETVAAFAGFVMASLREDTVAAIFGASDTIYYFMLDGRSAGQTALNSANFRPAPESAPKRTIRDVRERAEYVSKFDIMADVDWLPDGGLLVAYQSIEAQQALGRRWHLVGQDRAGTRRFESRNVSSLILGVDPATKTVVLVPPDAEAPNRLTIARLPD